MNVFSILDSHREQCAPGVNSGYNYKRVVEVLESQVTSRAALLQLTHQNASHWGSNASSACAALMLKCRALSQSSCILYDILLLSPLTRPPLSTFTLHSLTTRIISVASPSPPGGVVHFLLKVVSHRLKWVWCHQIEDCLTCAPIGCALFLHSDQQRVARRGLLPATSVCGLAHFECGKKSLPLLYAVPQGDANLSAARELHQ